MIKSLGFAVLIAVIAFSAMLITGCEEDKKDNPPSDEPSDKPSSNNYGWNVWRADSSTATLDYSISDDGVCTVTVGGTPEKHGVDGMWGAWKISAEYAYTGNVDTCYEYKFEAWTQSGDRNLHVQYYGNNNDSVYLGDTIHITTTRKTYTIIGSLPKSGKNNVSFQLADQLGTVNIKMLSLEKSKESTGEIIFNMSTWFDNHSSWAAPLYQTGTPTIEFNKTAKKITVKNIVNNWDGIDIELDKIGEGINPALFRVSIEIEGKVLERNQTIIDDNRLGQVRIQNKDVWSALYSRADLKEGDTFIIVGGVENNSDIKTLRITSNAIHISEESDDDVPLLKSFEITKIIITNMGER